jgi:DNA mismatch repair protein MutL
MNNKVHRLDDDTISKIAAGEIIERPASVVKELVENSIDSGATRIEIEIKNGGRQLIQVIDDGAGMDREDAVLAIERHTTSKIAEPDDLNRLKTLGFRGEALASIVTISQFEMVTKPAATDVGTLIEVKGGMLQKVKDCGAPNGTTIKVHDLFFNTPARLKYLKTIPTEAGYIGEIVSRMALAYPEISFRLNHHEYEVLFTPGNGNLHETIMAIFGKDTGKEMIPVNYQEGSLKITGYIGKPNIAKTNRNNEIFFINHRYFHNRILSAAVEKAYHTLLPIARYPFVILFLEIDPAEVDVNVHPSKMEVRFSNESELFKIFYHAVLKFLKDSCLLSEWIAPDEELNLKTVLAVDNQPAPQNMGINYTEFTRVAAQASSQVAEAVMETATAVYTVPETPVATMTMHRMDNACNLYIFPKALQDTYILALDEKGLLIIDQHAAHERVLYERYYYKAKEFLGTQSLLIAETVNLSHAQYKVVAERLTLFSEIGFELEVFGGQTIILRGVPLNLANMNYQQIIQDLIEQFMNFDTFKNPAEIKEAFIITMACKTAIKAGDNLNHLEMESLARDLFRCENPYTCPHGRPTVFRMNYEELAKKFLRR